MARSGNENTDSFDINSRDQTVRVRPASDDVTIQVPKSKAKDRKYLPDARLRAETGDFTSAGNFMSATVYGRDKALRALDVLMQKQALYALPRMAAEARTAMGDTAPDAPASKTDDTGNVACMSMLGRPKLEAMNLQPDSKSQQELLAICPLALHCDLAPPGLEYKVEGPLVWEEEQPSEKLRQMLQEATPAQREQAIEIASKLMARRISGVPTKG